MGLGETVQFRYLGTIASLYNITISDLSSSGFVSPWSLSQW